MNPLRTITLALLLSAVPALAQENARVRMRVFTPDSTHVGLLTSSTRDSLGIQLGRGVNARERRFARAELGGVERSLGRSAAPATLGAFAGVLAATAYVFVGHPGLPHFGGGDDVSAYIVEAIVYSVPAAFLGGLIAWGETPERWVSEP
jgi:hypothetical protein